MIWESIKIIRNFFDAAKYFYRIGKESNLSPSKRVDLTDNDIRKKINNRIYKNKIEENPNVKFYGESDLSEISQDEVIKIPDSVNVQNYISNNKDRFFKHALDRYRHLVENDLEKVHFILYKKHLFGINKDSVKLGLEEILNYFIQSEQYELAQEAKNLIDSVE